MRDVVKFFRANPQVFVLLLICVVLGLGTFLAVVFGLLAAGPNASNTGEPSGAIFGLQVAHAALGSRRCHRCPRDPRRCNGSCSRRSGAATGQARSPADSRNVYGDAVPPRRDRELTNRPLAASLLARGANGGDAHGGSRRY